MSRKLYEMKGSLETPILQAIDVTMKEKEIPKLQVFVDGLD